MSTQSEAALEAGLIATLLQMDYEYVQIVEEDNMYANFKRQLEVHNRKRLEEHGRSEFTTEEFERFLYTLKVVLALKRQRNSVTYIRLIRLMDSVYGWNF